MRYEITSQWIRTLPALVLFGVVLLASASVRAQDQSASNVNNAQVAGNDTSAMIRTKKAPPNVTPVLTNYKGITIGMSADEVRQKLDRLKEKGEKQDFFVFSDAESAQVYYDAEKKVSAVSVDYVGNQSNAPTPEAVLGKAITPRADGSMYELVRYEDAGFWVAYNRTAGNDPIVTVTIQKI